MRWRQCPVFGDHYAAPFIAVALCGLAEPFAEVDLAETRTLGGTSVARQRIPLKTDRVIVEGDIARIDAD